MFDNDITYDAIGNPINYYNGFAFGWSGRQLITATKGSNSYAFVYNPDGLRVQKTVNGVVHKYYYSGDQLLAEEWGNNLIIFLYDANGSPWEHEANEKGGTDFVYDLWPDDAPKNFFELIPLFFD